MIDDELRALVIDLVSSAHRFSRLAVTFGTENPARPVSRALSLLDELGPTRVTDFARADRSSQPAATALLARLEDRGLATRCPDPTDARAVLVSITDEGRRHLAARRHEIADGLMPHLAALDPARLDRLRAGLDELHAVLRAADDTPDTNTDDRTGVIA